MRSNRLFVFDMDGVLVASEKEWVEHEAGFYEKLFGKSIAWKIGDDVGVSIEEIYYKAKALGATITKEDYDRQSDEAAQRVYGRCTISKGADELAQYLIDHHWRIALLSASPTHWIEQVVSRLPWRDQLSAVLSLNAHKDLRSKPAPDGYRFLLKELGAAAEESVALEDSNPGIRSAKAAGLFTIAYREHLPDGYVQDAADATANTMKDVLAIISRATILL